MQPKPDERVILRLERGKPTVHLPDAHGYSAPLDRGQGHAFELFNAEKVSVCEECWPG